MINYIIELPLLIRDRRLSDFSGRRIIRIMPKKKFIRAKTSVHNIPDYFCRFDGEKEMTLRGPYGNVCCGS
jgi:hypothetical protein